MDNQYFIKDIVDVTQDILDLCVSDSTDDLRKSNDGLECVLKLPLGVEIPAELSEETFYNLDGITTVLEGVNWAHGDPDVF